MTLRELLSTLRNASKRARKRWKRIMKYDPAHDWPSQPIEKYRKRKLDDTAKDREE